MSIDNEWLHFKDNQNSNIKSKVELSPPKEKISHIKAPECSDIYISTQTKIAYLNQKIDLYKVFWLLPLSPQHRFYSQNFASGDHQFGPVVLCMQCFPLWGIRYPNQNLMLINHLMENQW